MREGGYTNYINKLDPSRSTRGVNNIMCTKKKALPTQNAGEGEGTPPLSYGGCPVRVGPPLLCCRRPAGFPSPPSPSSLSPVPSSPSSSSPLRRCHRCLP